MSLTKKDIRRAFGLLLGAGYPIPWRNDQLDFAASVWIEDLDGFTPEALLTSVRLYKRVGSTFWPKPIDLINIMRDHLVPVINPQEEFLKLKRMTLRLPAYTGSEFSRRQREETWEALIAAEYPEGIPSHIESAFQRIGGLSALRRALSTEGTFAINSLKKEFSQIASARAVAIERQDRLLSVMEITKNQIEVKNG